jgi:hypothetical protein
MSSKTVTSATSIEILLLFASATSKKRIAFETNNNIVATAISNKMNALETGHHILN